MAFGTPAVPIDFKMQIQPAEEFGCNEQEHYREPSTDNSPPRQPERTEH